MPIRTAITDLVPDAQTWRREIHQNPGLMYDVEATAEFVAERLRSFGCGRCLGRRGFGCGRSMCRLAAVSL